MNFCIRLLFTLSVCCLSLTCAKAEPLKWIGSSLPPFVWQEAGEAKGYACDLIKAMSQKLGRSSDIDFYPWARAVKMATEMPDYGIFPLARTSDREDDFLWLIPIIKVDFVFLRTRDSQSARYLEGAAKVAELRHQRIGYLRGSPIVKNLQAKAFTRVLEGTDYPELLRMLTTGAVDAIYAGRPMIISSIEPSGFRKQDFQVVSALGDAKLYIATSKSLPESEANLWRAAYQILVRDGTVEKLQRKYGLSKATESRPVRVR